MEATPGLALAVSLPARTHPLPTHYQSFTNLVTTPRLVKDWQDLQRAKPGAFHGAPHVLALIDNGVDLAVVLQAAQECQALWDALKHLSARQ